VKKNKSTYDSIQCELVIQCEKPHKIGLRHTAISGDVASRHLIRFLKKEFPRLRFNSGVVSTAVPKPARYKSSSKALGPQIDIIVYRGRPYDSIFNYAVVPQKRVILAIEVKKWITPKNFVSRTKGTNGQLLRLKRFTRKPVLLVGFRHHGDLQAIRRKRVADGVFVFSKASRHHYPDISENFRQRFICSGELLRLCKKIRSYLR
jgi:hypothetical protein